MNKSNLIELLRTFTAGEFKKFVLFVNSPFFNRENILINFTAILKEHFPEFNFTKEEIFNSLYPGKKFNDPLIRNILSDMMKLAEQFLIQIRIEKENFYKDFFLIRELSLKSQEKHSIKKLETLLRKFDEQNVKDDEHYFKRFLLENEKPGIYRRHKSIHHLEDENTPQIIENMLLSFMITVLKLNAYMINKTRFIFEYKYEMTFMDESLSYIEKYWERYKNKLYINFYYNAIKLFLTNDENYFFELRKIADEGYDNLNETEKKNVYVVLANYCSEKINEGELQYYRELFDLYKDIIRKGAHYEGLSFISHIFFKKVIITAMEVGEAEWTAGFLREYSHKLNEIHRNNSVCLANAYISFKKKNYNEALEHLSKVELEDASYKEEIKLLELKIFFEAGHSDQFDSAVDSFRHYCNSNKEISERRRSLYLEFVNAAVKLFRIKENPGKDFNFKLHQIKKEILNNKYTSNKKWLLEKAMSNEQ